MGSGRNATLVILRMSSLSEYFFPLSAVQRGSSVEVRHAAFIDVSGQCYAGHDTTPRSKSRSIASSRLYFARRSD